MFKIKLFSYLLLCFNLFSQQEDLEFNYVGVDWNVGDVKKIQQIDSSIIYLQDTIFQSTHIESNYYLEVINLLDTVYEIKFYSVTLDIKNDFLEENIEEDDFIVFIQNLMNKVQNDLNDFEYTLLVDKNTGQAFAVKNEDDIEKYTLELSANLLSLFPEKFTDTLSEERLDNLQTLVTSQMKSIMPAMIQTTLNAFNYIFQAYSFPYNLNKEIRQVIEVSDVNQMKNPDIINTAELVVKSSIDKDKTLLLDYEYLYDKAQMYQKLIIDKGQAATVSIDEFDCTERIITWFDRDNSWITKRQTIVEVTTGNIHVKQRDYITIH